MNAWVPVHKENGPWWDGIKFGKTEPNIILESGYLWKRVAITFDEADFGQERTPTDLGRSMNSIRQYRPAFFEGFENITVDFNTTEELLAIPFVKGFRHGDFYQFSLSDNHLMAEYKNGTVWRVVGTLNHRNAVDLPPMTGCWNHAYAVALGLEGPASLPLTNHKKHDN